MSSEYEKMKSWLMGKLYDKEYTIRPLNEAEEADLDRFHEIMNQANTLQRDLDVLRSEAEFISKRLGRSVESDCAPGEYRRLNLETRSVMGVKMMDRPNDGDVHETSTPESRINDAQFSDMLKKLGVDIDSDSKDSG